MTRNNFAPRLLTISLCIGALAIAGCDKTPSAPSAPAAAVDPATTMPAPSVPQTQTQTQAPAAQAAAVPAAYAPPSAEQLYQLVAPIALYPDKLVAQILAGATYPEQISSAHDWLGQNRNLKAGPLADAANQQDWDPSVKSLTAFRPVVDQLAGNIPWTTALGQAYYNDPADVMNAIQVMRQRAAKAGRLKNKRQAARGKRRDAAKLCARARHAAGVRRPGRDRGAAGAHHHRARAARRGVRAGL
jgi:hypothetical protein